MKTHTRLVSLITLGAIIGFMFASVSCSTAPVLKAQIAIASAQESWEKKTNLTTGQTVSLLGKWWTDLQSTRELNKLLKSAPIPLGPIQATQASPMMDYTSAKAVLEGLTSASSGWHQPAQSPEPPESPVRPSAPKVRPTHHDHATQLLTLNLPL